VSNGVTQYAAMGGVSHLDLQRVSGPARIPALDHPRFASDLNAQFYVMGQEAAGLPRLVAGGVVLEDSTFSGTRVPALGASVSLADRVLSVDAIGAFERLGSATLGTRAALALDGRVDGWFVVHDLDRPWTEDNVEGDGRVVLLRSTIESVTIDSATIDGRLADGVATIRTIDVRGSDTFVHVDGTLGLHEPAPSSGLNVTADIPDLSHVGRHLGRPLAGAAALQATVTGTADSPVARGTLGLQQPAYGNAVRALTSNTTFDAEWPDRQPDRLAWQLTTDATFVQVGGTKIQQLAAAANGGLREMNVDIRADQESRSVGLEGRVTLLPDSRELLLRSLALTTQDVAWSLPAGRSAVIRYGTDRLDIADLTLVRGEQQIAVSGSFDLGTNGPAAASGAAASLDVAIRGVELGDVNQALLGTRQLSGRLDGVLTLTGTRRAPVVEGSIVARDGSVEGVPYASVDARGTYRDRRLTFDALLDQAPGAQLRVTGAMPVAGVSGSDTGLDVTVSGGPVSLGLIQALTTEVDNVAGTAAMNVRITGSTAAPSVDGTATIAGGAFDVGATGARYRNLDAELAFAGSRLTIGRLQVADADGDQLTAEGGLDVLGEVGRRAVDVRVRARRFSVLRNALGTADVDVDFGVTGTLSALAVRGTATLDSGRLEVAEILERTTSTPYSTTAQAALDPSEPPPPPRAPTMLERTNIDVQLRLPGNLVLRGRGLRVSNGGFGIGDMNIIAGGTFDIRKPPGAGVEVLGTLEVARGSYTFQGRRFDIAGDSEVRFRGGPISDPSLNISATREVSGITAEVRLRGTARSPDVTIASRPPLDQGDVLSLIVFNQPINSLGAAERVNLGERAASMAAGAITSPLADSIARALNLDMVEIQAPTSEGSAGAVAVGGRLGSRLFVGLRQQFGRDESSLLTLEYRISEVLRLVTSVARGTLQAHATRRMDQGGVDLIFVIRY
jgi:translocation and assembly module TamB